MPLGACEQQAGRNGHGGKTWWVGSLLARLTGTAGASQGRVVVQRLERQDFVTFRNPRVDMWRGGRSCNGDAGIIWALVASRHMQRHAQHGSDCSLPQTGQRRRVQCEHGPIHSTAADGQ